MKTLNVSNFYAIFDNEKNIKPLRGQLELTYRCPLRCVHCDCRRLADRKGELTTSDWKRILDEIRDEGCVFLTLTGGDPIIRKDFPELYLYAKKKGFVITLFTSGQLLTKKVLDLLSDYPPYSMEITLNGIKPRTYETITQVRGSFVRILKNIKEIKKRELPLILKSNCLKQNQGEIGKIKGFTDTLLGKKKRRFFFKYGPFIHPGLDRGRNPLKYRLSYGALLDIKRQDGEIWQEHRKSLKGSIPHLKRGRNYLYHCNSWQSSFYVTPYGRLKFCYLSENFSVDLKTASFKEGFYGRVHKILNEQFKTDSKCRNCRLRAICRFCPARAYLETGNEEGPVPYFCELAKARQEEMLQYGRKSLPEPLAKSA